MTFFCVSSIAAKPRSHVAYREKKKKLKNLRSITTVSVLILKGVQYLTKLHSVPCKILVQRACKSVKFKAKVLVREVTRECSI